MLNLTAKERPTYKGQRALVVASLLAHPKGISFEDLCKDVNRDGAYERTFVRRVMVVTVPQSVKFQVKEMIKKGELTGDLPKSTMGASTRPKVNPSPPFSRPREKSGTATVSAGSMDLLTEWEKWEPSGPRFVLCADRDLLESTSNSKRVVNFGSWPAAISAPDFCQPDDTRLHLGLLPQPFIGDVRRASIYVLSLNPGLEPTDYYGEYEVPEFRSALLATLKQRFNEIAQPFLFLDPRYSWHGGFRWWHGKLSGVIARLRDEWRVSFGKARKCLASEMASIELLPYHSARFKDSGWLGKLSSVALAKAFVKEAVVPRVERGEAIAIVLRKAGIWELPPIPGVIEYSGRHAQGARLGPDSPGGRAIIERLLRFKTCS
jgi:hypothetical protein